MLRIITIIVLTVVITRLSTYGFKPSRRIDLKLSPQQSITKENLKKTVKILSEEIGERNFTAYDNLTKAADHIISTFEALGYSVDIMPYKIDNQIYKNVIAKKPTVKANDEIIIVGAHYDSCYNPGADDNASAVASLIELARLLKNQQLNRNLRFIAFVNEEPPFFMTEKMGSRVYAKRAREKNENITAMICLEMLGYYSEAFNSQRYFPIMGLFYPNRGNFIAIIGNFVSRHIAGTISKSFKDQKQIRVETLITLSSMPGTNFSDHWSFWIEGYPAVMVTDTAFLRNPHYHKQSDLPQTLDYEKMTAVVYGLKNAIINLANK